MAFAKEPPYAHGTPARTAIVLCNLGTPDAPTASALRRYLGQFLSDSRVVEIPKPIWWMILHGIILRVRPAKSAAKYASIWTEQGSPLKAITEQQATLLQVQLQQAGHDVIVRAAMRYGQRAIDETLNQLKAEGVQRILVLPAYPQYSATTTASVFDEVYRWGLQQRRLPELRFINHYHDDASYIQSLAAQVREHWQEHGRGECLVMSFHGVPERTLHLGDPYHCECMKTARLLAQALALQPEDYRVTFQSRFGKAKWLEPATEPALVSMAHAGIRKVDVICPGFTSDCLETLEEIQQEAKVAFVQAGGERFNYMACLNTRPDWIRAMTALSIQHLQGWPTQTPTDVQALHAQRQLALAGGATN